MNLVKRVLITGLVLLIGTNVQREVMRQLYPNRRMGFLEGLFYRPKS